jgi:hypothetical protein
VVPFVFLPHDDVLGGHIRRYLFFLINKKTKLHSDGLILKIKHFFFFPVVIGQAEMLGQQLPPHSCLIVFFFIFCLKILTRWSFFFSSYFSRKKIRKEMFELYWDCWEAYAAAYPILSPLHKFLFEGHRAVRSEIQVRAE